MASHELLDQSKDPLKTVNELTHRDGVIWASCHCGRVWPFPYASAPGEREWLCHPCVQALWSETRRAAQAAREKEVVTDLRGTLPNTGD